MYVQICAFAFAVDALQRHQNASDFLQRPARIPSSWRCCGLPPESKVFGSDEGEKPSKKSIKIH